MRFQTAEMPRRNELRSAETEPPTTLGTARCTGARWGLVSYAKLSVDLAELASNGCGFHWSTKQLLSQRT